MSKGIDILIEKAKTRLSSKLFLTNDCDWFGRIHRNVKQGETIPERFISGKNDLDVLLNDTKDLTCFFDVQPAENYSNVFNSEVWVCFSVNLAKLYPTVTTERATEYVHEDVINELKKVGGWKVTGLVRGLPAFSEYSKVKESDNRHPFYLFRINCDVKYPINC